MNRNIDNRRDPGMRRQAQPRNKTLLYPIRDAEALQVYLASQMPDRPIYQKLNNYFN